MLTLKKKKDAADTQPQKSSRKGLLNTAWLALVGVVAAVAVGAFMVNAALLQSAQVRESNARAQATVKQLAASVSQQTAALQDHLQAMAAAPVLQNALVDSNSRSDFMTTATTLLPHAKRVLLTPSGAAAVEREDPVPVSFQMLDMIRRAEAGETVPAEASKLNGGWAFLFVEPVYRAQQADAPWGTLLVVFDHQAMQQVLAGFNPAIGQVSLQQRFGNKAQAVLSLGTGNGPALEAASQTPHWLVSLSPKASGQPLVSPLAYWGVWALVAVLASVLVLVAFVLLQKQVRRETSQLIRFMQASFDGERRKLPEFSLDVVHNLAVGFQQGVKQMGRPAEGKSEPAAAPAPATTAAPETGDEPLFQESDALDIALFDDDDSADATPQKDTTMTLPDADVSAGIFRAYDIRGVVGDTLTEDVAYLVGRAFAAEANAQGQSKVCVGYDGRLSSPMLAESLTRGLTDSGLAVVNIGMAPTPVLYFATHHLETGTGIMVTGSHNPPDYNGMKMMIAGNTLSGDAIQGLYQRIQKQDFVSGSGEVVRQSVDDDYVDTIVGDIAVAAPLKVVVDAGNGVAGVLGPRVLEELGCEVIPIFCEIDGNFPNHHPDPGKPENLKDLIAKVQETGADLGLAFDGDGDRVGVVTNRGKMIYPDRLLMLFAKDVVSRNPGADVIFDVKCSRRLQTHISQHGGRPIMWKTGHSLIKAKMKETGALLAGEMSGHIFFKERWFGFDDGLYSAARLVEILGFEDRDAEAVFAELPEDVSTPEINIKVTDDTKFSLVEALSKRGDFGEGSVSTIDGVRVDYPDGWGLVRASNTTPVLVLRFEAETEDALNRIRQQFNDQLAAIDPALQIPA